ncbi:restriction endonuclease subunit S [Methylobacterium sp. J-072]|uniref:restriction endonuclease subunit S n=1 Tax=Methylobacterium sp. J-072 TaxID=2836651 RepID=UPI001FBBF2F7|nr:restriction endonuclease subunit S [Methylobacterium sp. J-072]MCJ2093767.1 restriction endonuclease subunit S [Methylobacterium sp. J-072]
MTQAPIGWTAVTLDYLTRSDSPICYGVLKPGDPDPEGVPMVRVTDIRTNEFDSSQVAYITPKLDAEFSRSHVTTGDVLISVQGTVGRVAVVPKSFPRGNISRTIARIRPIDPSLSRWIQSALLAPEQQAKIDADTGGTTRDSLNIGDLREITIPLAPANEQRRIIAKIDTLSAQSKRARDHLQHVSRLTEKYKESILRAACDGSLTEDWRKRHGAPEPRSEGLLSLIGTPIRNGLSIRGTDQPPGIRSLRLSALRNRTVDLDAVRFLPIDARRAEPYLIQRGDILVSRGNGTKHFVGIASLVPSVDQPTIFPDTAFRIRLNQSVVLPEWFALVWNAPQVRMQIESVAKTTAGIWKVSQGDLARIKLIVPCIDEQCQVLARASSAIQWVDRLASHATHARKLTDHLDQAVLSRAFRGELVAQDPGDEPASVLLERIKGERTGPTPARRGRGRPRLASAT